jgi:hypothetical protein
MVVLLVGCSGGITFQTDKTSYELLPSAVLIVVPDLTNGSNKVVTYDPCNLSLGQSTLGYSSLERQTASGWQPVGSVDNQRGPGCDVKVGCGLDAQSGSLLPHSNQTSFCRFAFGLAPSDPPGTYRAVTTVQTLSPQGGSSMAERITSNAFEVRASPSSVR